MTTAESLDATRDKPDPHPDRPTTLNPVEIEAYKMLGALYSAEETSFYTRNNILAVLQVGLLAAVAGILSKVFDQGTNAAAVLEQLSLSVKALCAAGVIAAVAWFFTIRRSLRITELLTDQLVEIERSATGLRPGFRVFTLFERGLSTKAKAFRPQNVRLSTIWTIAAFLFTLIWMLLGLLISSAGFRHAVSIPTPRVWQ